MKRTLSEQKVLKKLGITDFRHMTKDKVIEFASILPRMDPEVAKKALEQFPSFKDLASDLVVQYKATIDKAMEKNESSQNAFFTACNNIIQSLQLELKNDSITIEDRNRIEDKMIQVAGMIGEKDTENKSFLLKALAIGAATVAFVGGTAAAILGSNTQISKRNDDDDYNNEA